MTALSITIIAIIVVVVLWLIGVYNGLIRLKNKVEEAWSDIDVQLKRRYDLIPNLVSTVKGYASHEKEVFTKVTEARANAMQAGNVKDKAQAENMLSETLKSLFAVAENYPQLRASENFSKLQDDLTDTENKIQAARRFYNGMARDFNTKIQVFPNNVVAGPFGFKARDYFELGSEEEKEPVKVAF